MVWSQLRSWKQDQSTVCAAVDAALICRSSNSGITSLPTQTLSPFPHWELLRSECSAASHFQWELKIAAQWHQQDHWLMETCNQKKLETLWFQKSVTIVHASCAPFYVSPYRFETAKSRFELLRNLVSCSITSAFLCLGWSFNNLNQFNAWRVSSTEVEHFYLSFWHVMVWAPSVMCRSLLNWG